MHKVNNNQIRTPDKKLLIGEKKIINGRMALEIYSKGRTDVIFIEDLLKRLLSWHNEN